MDGDAIHLFHVEQRVLGRTSLPERVAIGKDHVTGFRDARVSGKFEVSVDVADIDSGNGLPGTVDVFNQFVLREIAAQQNLVTDRENIGMTGVGNLDGVGQFFLVLLPIAVQPHTDHALEPVLCGDPGNQLIAFGAGKGSYPTGIRLDKTQPLKDLSFAQLGTRTLTLDVGTETYPVDLCVEDLSHECPQRRSSMEWREKSIPAKDRVFL
jgi:hypothetical protein